jgi:hypothetical protein
MNLFKKWFSRSTKKSEDSSNYGAITVSNYGEKLQVSPPGIRVANYPTGMTISFVKATGGYVVEINHHDDVMTNSVLAIGPSAHSSRRSELFIVPEDADLASEIGKIITLALLKK